MIFFPIFTVLMSAGHLNTSAFWRYLPSKAPFLGSSNKPLSILFLLELKSKWPGTQIFPVRESPRLPAKKPLFSPAYISQPRATCLLLLMQLIPVALALALAKAGSNKPAKIAMMAMTTNNSIRVKPCCFRFIFIGNFRNSKGRGAFASLMKPSTNKQGFLSKQKGDPLGIAFIIWLIDGSPLKTTKAHYLIKGEVLICILSMSGLRTPPLDAGPRLSKSVPGQTHLRISEWPSAKAKPAA